MAEKPIQITAAVRLRRAANQLRRTDLDAASRERAAEALDQLATELESIYRRMATRLVRSGAAVLTAALAMLVAGVWVDWRWAGTAAVVAVAGAVLLGLGVAGSKGDGHG